MTHPQPQPPKLHQPPFSVRTLLLGVAGFLLVILGAQPALDLWTVNSIGLSHNRYLITHSEAVRGQAVAQAEAALKAGLSTTSFWRVYGAMMATNPTEAGFSALNRAAVSGALDRTALLWYGEVAAATGHWTEAQDAYAQVNASNLLISRAEEALGAGREELAANWFRAAARCLQSASTRDEAHPSSSRWIAHGAGEEEIRSTGYYARAYLRIGKGFLVLGEADTAETWLKHAAAEAARESPGLRIRQEINFSLAQAATARPVEDDAHLRATRTRVRTLVAEGLALGEDAWAHTQAAKSLLAVFDREEAITHCETAVSLDPLFPEAYLLLGAILREDGLVCLARDVYEEGNERLPADEEIMVALALATWETRSPANSLPVLQEASAAGCSEPYVYAALGDCYQALGLLTDARQAYRQGLNLTPGSQPLLERLRACPTTRGILP